MEYIIPEFILVTFGIIKIFSQSIRTGAFLFGLLLYTPILLYCVI